MSNEACLVLGECFWVMNADDVMEQQTYLYWTVPFSVRGSSIIQPRCTGCPEITYFLLSQFYLCFVNVE